MLTGCFVDSHWDSLQDSTATYVVDNKRKSHIPDILSAHFCGEILDIAQLEPQVFSYTTPEQIFRTRTNIKIQDGCDNFCTFCIIPFVRGRAVSRNADSVLQEAKEAIAAGSKELILTGVNMSRYNDSEIRLAALMERILELDGDFRVRLSSIEPDNLSAAFLDLMSHPKFCPHLHLCLQSGSDRILLKMRRMYSLSQYQEIVHCLRKQHEHFNITTDIIVGFPKEEQEDFLQSVEAVSTFGISHVHIFPFSVRSGTRAERMTGTIPAEEQKRRCAILKEHAHAEKIRYRKSLIGTTERILIEKMEQGTRGWQAYGFGQHYAPVCITKMDTVCAPNTFRNAYIYGIQEEDGLLFGAPI